MADMDGMSDTDDTDPDLARYLGLARPHARTSDAWQRIANPVEMLQVARDPMLAEQRAAGRQRLGAGQRR